MDKKLIEGEYKMALIICPECGRKISDKALNCPGCGIGQDEIQKMLAEKTEADEKTNLSEVMDQIEKYPTVSVVSRIDIEQLSKISAEKSEAESRMLNTLIRYSEQRVARKDMAEGEAEVLVANAQEAEQKNYESAYQKGDVIRFGKFDGRQIEWIVIGKQDDRILVLSRYALEAKTYHSVKKAQVTWETSEMRRYLNTDFITACFDLQERRMIVETEIYNPDNYKYGTPGGRETKDKIFLLSLNEVEEMYNSDEERKCVASDSIRKSCVNKKLGTSDWWLRTPGSKNINTVVVDSKGYIFKGGLDNIFSVITVRPAMWIRVE